MRDDAKVRERSLALARLLNELRPDFRAEIADLRQIADAAPRARRRRLRQAPAPILVGQVKGLR